ncbi:MAG: arylsulfatase [Planctomycetota bacterium]|nr:MAG: arylsulfatase [Planctomycetota bacterium]
MTTSKPNVIFFFTDQQRWDTSSLFGNPMNLTPNFDRMAMEGTHCYNTTTCQPVCLPARMSLQTGKYPSQMNCYDNNAALKNDEETIGHLFQKEGYRTSYIGKWHMSHDEPVPPEQRTGYDDWLGSNLLEFVTDAYDTKLWDNDGNEARLPGYRVDGQTDAAIRYIDEQKDNPFFLFCSYIEPHFQNTRDDYPAPTGYEEKYMNHWIPPDLRSLVGTSPQHLPGYYGMVKRLDEALGRMLDALKSLNLLENTIIVYSTDHGCHFKTRNSEYKRSCHDSSIRIPLAFSGPGFKSGGRLQEMISLIDIPPTLLDACNINVPDSMQGRSILPLTKGRVEDWPEETYTEMYDTHLSRCVRTHRWKYSIKNIQPGINPDAAWEFEEDCLYDLMADPYELSNRIGLNAYRDVSDVMKSRLVRRMIQTGEKEPKIINAPSIASGQKVIKESEIYL